MVEVEQNILQDPYSSIWIKVGVSASYLIQGIESVILISFVLYETQGLAGPYRTVVNQLLSGLYAIVSNLHIILIKDPRNNAVVIFLKCQILWPSRGESFQECCSASFLPD